MSETIVVGVTNSPASQRAITWASRRATAPGTSLRLVAVVGGAVGVVGEDEVVVEALQAAQDLLASHAVMLIQLGFSVDTAVLRGDPVRQLIQASVGAALLVIGSDHDGRDHAKHHGVHGTRIVAGAHCPVVIVPDTDVSPRSGVIVGVDGSPISEAAIAFAAAEADRSREPLIAVAVWTPLIVPRNPVVYSEQYLDSMQALTEEALAMSLAGLSQTYPDLEIVRLVESGYPSQVINRLAESARLVVVGSHGRGAVGRFLLGSISHEVLQTLKTVTAVVR